MVNQRIKEIDILKGFSIFMVLLGHSIIVFPINLNSIPWCGFLHGIVSTVHIPLFCAVSGFCYSFRNAKDFYEKKTSRILIPYLVFCAIGLLPQRLFPSLVNGEGETLLNYLVAVLFKGTSVWFLYMLMIIFLFFPIVEKATKTQCCLIMTVVIAVGVRFFSFWPKWLSLNNVTEFFVFFLAGYLAKQNKKLIIQRGRVFFENKNVVLVCSCILWIAGFSVNNTTSLPYLISNGVIGLCTSLAGIVFFVFLANTIKETLVAKLLMGIGQYSLQLYLFNGYILTVSRTMLVKVFGITSPFLIISGNLIALVCGGYIIIRFIICRIDILRRACGVV